MTTKTHPAPIIHDLDTGTAVRSFDFPSYYPDLGVEGLALEGDRACYIEGEIVGFITLDHALTVDGETFGPSQDCDRYAIRVSRIVRRGVEVEVDRRFIFPPVNGTPCSMGGVCFGVQPMGSTSLADLDDRLAENARMVDDAHARLNDIAMQIARLQETASALSDDIEVGMSNALAALDSMDATLEDDAEDLFYDYFKCFPSEVR